MYAWSMSLRVRTLGSLLTSARLMTPKVTCIWVWVNSWLRTISSMASRRSSMTTRMPSRSLSSRRSVMPSILLSFTSSAMFSIIADLFTW
ncbi:MAG: hypothetical protein A4E31_00680 [Methanomassiliicoccales archaeon PtaU1.Bin030]|nr:MAG: hypothetical protein A4E31_00680 [Methanomassiliicoccales archaeon PtaU1.Bin030]